LQINFDTAKSLPGRFQGQRVSRRRDRAQSYLGSDVVADGFPTSLFSRGLSALPFPRPTPRGRFGALCLFSKSVPQLNWRQLPQTEIAQVSAKSASSFAMPSELPLLELPQPM
jgi:hypothetical protein